jgi:hypothetical protein
VDYYIEENKRAAKEELKQRLFLKKRQKFRISKNWIEGDGEYRIP